MDNDAASAAVGGYYQGARGLVSRAVRGPRWNERVTPETVGATRSERAAARRRSARQGEAA